ncbi:MAG: alpha/beta hydrolase [Pseudomonadota bacterium]|nr:alpha/beta hydrolase [Pseudomonadota bacterium]
MFSSSLDSRLTKWAASRCKRTPNADLITRMVITPVGPVRVFDSQSSKPCVMFVPDGPNVIEHYGALFALLSQHLRVVCFDMPGFGFSLPEPAYLHSLDQGASAVIGVLNSLQIQRATLAFSCANGFYAVRAAQLAPQRIASLFLSQTPSLEAMHAWADRVIPWPVRVPVLGQIVAWFARHKTAHAWYDVALPKTTDREPYRRVTHNALSCGGCFCLAGVVQGLARESLAALDSVDTPCTMIWGAKDRSHHHTRAESLLECLPTAEIIRFEDCGHFPDLEQPERYAELLISQINNL